MSNSLRRPILYKGEAYSATIEKKRNMHPKEPPVSYEESRIKLLQDISSVTQRLEEIPSSLKLPTESIVCFRVGEKWLPKSYYPEAIFNQSNDMEEIGSRLWRKTIKENSKNINENFGKLFFVRTTQEGLQNFEKKLNKAESALYENFKLDIRKISSLDILSTEEQILGFSDDWQSGRLEVVLHPFSIDRSLSLSHFKELIKDTGIDVNEINTKQYDAEGLIFISLPGNRKVIDALTGYNPLRTVHPLTFRNIPSVTRDTLKSGSPLPPVFTKKPLIVLGVIDGGYVKGNACLDNYVEVINSVTGTEVPEFSDHGTLVTSAALYGGLHNYKNTDVLPEPNISVRNFRVLSADTKDPDLYCVIDAIEKIVPANSDIQSYNLSLGPNGPILDDYISRFTYSCDTLSKQYNVLFHVAVGNDGEVAGSDRIQSPADIVNGLAVAAYTLIDGKHERAPYSCKGPGREGNKMKPDLSAFGGCDRFPLQLLGSTSGFRTYTSGTSFSSPQTSAISARLIGGSKGVINALTARLMLTHEAKKMPGIQGHCVEFGHGIMPDNVDNIMSCIDKSYTLIYEGEIPRGKYREFEIPWIEELSNCSVNFKWTAAVLTSVDAHSPEDYTTSSIEIGFYPNSKKYLFTKGNKSKKVDIEENPTLVQQLELDGWKRGNTPAGEYSPKPFATEGELRDNLKWDSIDIRQSSKKASSIKQPIFHVHAISRGRRRDTEKVKFAIALTVEAPKAAVDIYQRVRAKYDALLPIRMEIQVPVPVKS